MKIYVKFDINAICAKVLGDQFKDFNVQFRMNRMGEVEILQSLPPDLMQQLEKSLADVGITIVDDRQYKLTYRIKEAINDMIYTDAEAHKYKISTYLSEKLQYSYNHLSEVFSQTTYNSIENFVILKKIDYAKTLIIEGKLTFGEIAEKLNYSSSAHLSTQFKRTTGFTPTSFQNLIQKRQERRLSAF